MGGGEIHQCDIRVHARGQHTALVGSALGLGAADGGHHQRGGAGEGGGVPGSPAGIHGGIANDLKHIQVAAFQSASGAQGHVHASLHIFGDGGCGAAHFGGGHRGGDAGYLLLAQELALVVLQRHTARGGGGHIEEPVAA